MNDDTGHITYSDGVYRRIKGKTRYVFEIQSNAYDGYWIGSLRLYTQISDDICVEEEDWLFDEKKTFDTREKAWDYALESIEDHKNREVER